MLRERLYTDCMLITDINEFHAGFAATFNARDVEGLLGLYEDGAVFVARPGTVVSDGGGLRQAIEGFVGSGFDLSLETKDVLVKGDLAPLRATWKLKSGDLVMMSGESVEIARRQADGGWKYAIDNPFGA
ncbi:MAG: DUF4440 domain-containing protein [Acidobacteria bacterium]|nr:DUF4440 domain-containing protein [Acidobacteriota bacterium]